MRIYGNKNTLIQKIVAILLLAVFLLSTTSYTKASSLDQQIQQKGNESDNLQNQITQLEGQIKNKQNQAATLQNQIAIFDADISQKQLEIKKKQVDIDKTNLEINRTQDGIKSAEQKISHEKVVLAEYIRTLNYSDDATSVELLLSDSSFSEILDKLQYIQTLQGNVSNTLTQIAALKSDLEIKQKELVAKKANIEKQKHDIQMKVSELKGAQQEKQELLAQTKNDEKTFQVQVAQARTDYQQKQSEINALERALKESQIKYGDPTIYASGFVWPLPPGVGIITCPFHCNDYFPGLVHTGTDLAAPVGTPIYSATSGVVVHSGWSTNHGGYGQYVAVSSGDLLVIYGHQSQVIIPNGATVSAGQLIGKVGSTGFSSGPHLHFEIRRNGVPINAMQFY